MTEAEKSEKENKVRSGIWVHFIYAVLIISIIGVFALLIQEKGRKGSVTIKYRETTVEMHIEDGTTTVKNLLDFLFSEEDRKKETMALLKEFYRVYDIADTALISEIEKQKGSSEISEELRGLLYELRGPFERSLHTFYNIEKPDIVSAIEKLGFEHPVSEGLRSLLNYRKGPFEENAAIVFLSVPQGVPIKLGRAASCKNNKFYRRCIRIFNKQRTRSIDVFVSGRFPCPENSETNGDIFKLLQLSYEDMNNLIGNSPLMEKETGYAEITLDPN